MNVENLIYYKPGNRCILYKDSYFVTPTKKNYLALLDSTLIVKLVETVPPAMSLK